MAVVMVVVAAYSGQWMTSALWVYLLLTEARLVLGVVVTNQRNQRKI